MAAFFFNGRLYTSISDKWSGFCPVDTEILRFKEAKGARVHS